MEQREHPRAWKVLLAFSIIYFVWGSTFLAIRVGVQHVPPFLFAALRFIVAGAALFGWMRATGTPSPSAREWRSVSLLALLIFVCDYGLLFWAEKRVPSGIAAVMLATIPAFMALAEILILRTQRLTPRLGIAMLIGLAGVMVLVSRTVSFGDAPIDPVGACALIMAAVSWAISSALSKKLQLPSSKAISSGAQMLAGGLMLLVVSATFGELRGFQIQAVPGRIWLALLYLIVAGSIIGFTAYVWLIHHESPTRVGTYAYVNPVVAVLIGYFLGGEALGARTILGTALVLVSVVVITTTKKTPSAVPGARPIDAIRHEAEGA